MKQRFVAGARATALALILVGVGAGAARAEDTPGWSYDLANHLMSPYCPGRTLPDCTSEQAAELRRWIIDQEKAGRSRAEVESQIVARYGDIVLQAPRATGFGLAAYVIPIVLAVVGGAILALFFRRHAGATRAAGAANGAPPTPLDPELERQLDDEMRGR